MGKFKLIIVLIITILFCFNPCRVNALSTTNIKMPLFLDDLMEYENLWTGNFGNESSSDSNNLDNVVTTINDYILKPIRYLIPILFLILTSFDFAKSIFTDDKNGIGKAKTNLLKRTIISIIVFFVPMIVDTLMILFNIS